MNTPSRTAPAFVRFDGSIIYTDDRQTAIDWYQKHLGLTLAWDSPEEEMALLLFPNKIFSLALKTAPDDIAGDLVIDPRVYLTLGAPNLHATHAKLREQGVICTDIYQGPGGEVLFDFFDLNGIRLTASSLNLTRDVDPEVYALAQAAPDALFVAYAPHRIGVRDLAASRAWYTQHLGLDLLFEAPSEGLALLNWPDSCPIWLEQLDADQFDGPEPAAARLFFLTEDIEAAQRYFQAQGFDVSEIQGSPEQLRTCHTFDPDGNQIHFWGYPNAQ